MKSKKKNDKGRTAFVLAETRKNLATWVKGKGMLTVEPRVNAANVIRAAAQKAFPNSSEKWLKLHDLRHSSAIELCQEGVSLLLISQLLGNKESICQKHYAGIVASPESMD